MKRLVILLILLVLPIVCAEEVYVPETFKTENVQVTSYFYTGEKLVASKDLNGVKYYSQDRLGSNRLTTDSNSNQIGETKTLPFGEEIINNNKFSFTGKELDSELYYFGARYYEPETGRFTNVDPLKENNDYTYVINSPFNAVDPDGKKVNIILDAKLEKSVLPNPNSVILYNNIIIRLESEINNPLFIKAIGLDLNKDQRINLVYRLIKINSPVGGYFEPKDNSLNINVLPSFIGSAKNPDNVDMTLLGRFILIHETKHFLDSFDPNFVSVTKIGSRYYTEEEVVISLAQAEQYYKKRIELENRANRVARTYFDSLLASGLITRNQYDETMGLVSDENSGISNLNSMLARIRDLIKTNGPNGLIDLKSKF